MKKLKLRLLLLIARHKISKGRKYLQKCSKLHKEVEQIHNYVRIQGGNSHEN